MENTEQKEFNISKEAYDKWVEFKAYENIVLKLLKLPFFTHKRLVKYSKLEKRTLAEFWGIISKEYPDIRDKRLSFDGDRQKLTILE